MTVTLIIGDALKWMLEHQPDAFLLLTLIITRSELSNLVIGDYQACGLSIDRYQKALTYLKRAKYIETLKESITKRSSTVRLRDNAVYALVSEGDHLKYIKITE
jgi:hypothetical protein